MKVIEFRVQVEGDAPVEARLTAVPAQRGPVEWDDAAIHKADHMAGSMLGVLGGGAEVRVDGDHRIYRRRGSDGWKPVPATPR
ncbi:MAG TPA: hypothetical protein VD931_12480 [Baekduia sp.]|nr:hypothetical protein [Baekduia sp.]